MSDRIEIWTDGACSGNPGPGGWGALLKWNGHEKELWGGEADSTNNRMELTAAIEALNALKKRSSVILHTDSTYVKDGLTKWMFGWKKNGWKTAAKKPVKNKDLWQALDQARLDELMAEASARTLDQTAQPRRSSLVYRD